MANRRPGSAEDWVGRHGGTVMRSTSQFGYLYRSQPPTFSAWTMAIVFATVAMLSFAIDQAVVLSPFSDDQVGQNLPSLLHPVQLIETLIDAASE
jgi:hypothetical protein